jgi:clan AA aspartic protease (TIGR02281 family)
MVVKRSASTLLATVFAATLSWAVVGPASASEPVAASSSTRIALRKDGGVYVVPVSMNGVVSLEFIVDSGATDVNIPEGAYKKMLKAGTIQESDSLGFQNYRMADGTSERVPLVRIRALKIGNMVVKDVVASVAGQDAVALLGQSFLERFASWSLDNGGNALVLSGGPLPSMRPADGKPQGTQSIANLSGSEPVPGKSSAAQSD